MLDLRVVRERPDAVERALAARGGTGLVTPLLAADATRRRLVRTGRRRRCPTSPRWRG
ncbi:MAG: hypothetical protein HYS77_16815 [Candidatus Rokubacteria bacterium]|nr:hypothetical protein [Candidatus Rokubacteria bacterium]